MLDADFALFNVDTLVTVAPGCHPAAEGELGVLRRAALAAKDGKVVWVGPMDEMREQVKLAPTATVLNTHGRTVLPGFVDPHTHPVFAGDRVSDFYARALGASYEDQLKFGGIMRTVRETREKSEDALLDLVYQRADTFLQYGTTTIGAKTGYGLTLADELKSLRVLNRLQHLHSLKIVPAFLGAHVVPADYDGDADSYVAEVAELWLPAAKNHAQMVDVWCDEGAFTTEQARLVLLRARELGFALTVHANQVEHGGGARLAAEIGALSADHLDYLDADDIAALREHGTVAVLLPGASFFTAGGRYAPARRLIESGVPVALSTDFNPGTSYTQNMLFILTLAVLQLQMTAEEAIQAATLNAARAIGMDDYVGSLEPGKSCDCSVYCVGRYQELPYFYAMHLVEWVIAEGRILVEDGRMAKNSRAPARTA